jgi:ethanolamine ammonia-lyase small subunit
MTHEEEKDEKLAQTRDLPGQGLSEILKKVRARTPARLLAGRSGAAYRTSTQMELREAHAAARDAVRAELNFVRDFGEDFAQKWNLLDVSSQAVSKQEYLLRPDLGRHLNDASRAELNRCCAAGQDLQVVIGDGLSVTAVATQVPRLLALLCEGVRTQGWNLGGSNLGGSNLGSIPVIRYCRVGILNDIGELLRPRVAVLLIGERPGLATAESLSAYMAYRPKISDTDAHRNLISNIHARGVSAERAVQRILNLAALMMKTQDSGCQLREELQAEVARFINQPGLSKG